ncbi:SPW repeat domain-containing protein [Conexibacter arvalis]|uniref:SPW repeat-containing integral membrane domain-containing protein n=1 Tax=Conexibacter arvalis TaxID=912552 RepID=A0A840IJU1_9ACTN|nr:SPW repeat protein [Conexibacter arvalis]MBB4664210.1 hypothetical protein [Conexibacter arvalis]
MRRPIPSRVHALLDYPAGALLVVAPFLFGASDAGGAAVAVPVVIGALILLQSTITDYEYSVENALPLPAHLAADVVGGVVLAASPWLFGFADEGLGAWLPYLLAGLGLLAAGLLTQQTRGAGAVVTRDVRHGEPRTG